MNMNQAMSNRVLTANLYLHATAYFALPESYYDLSLEIRAYLNI